MFLYIRIFTIRTVYYGSKDAFLSVYQIKFRIFYAKLPSQRLNYRIYKICVFIYVQVFWTAHKRYFDETLQILAQNMHCVILRYNFLSYIKTLSVYLIQLQLKKAIYYLLVNTGRYTRVFHNL